MTKYTITVGKKEFEVDSDDLKTLDFASNEDSGFHVLKDNKAFDVRLLRADHPNKTITLSVNGNSYTIQIDDAYDQRVKQMGLLSAVSQKAKDLIAPMPGLVVNVMVDEGQEITEGTPLLILSAMKMENILLAQADGMVKSIKVKKEDAVDKGQLIIEIE
ncbi:MAG: biotin/lipoyl-containing protein [Pricia sp.]